jgi:WhiB family transcriptional regulator, redox-sensing transcriptional regulator
MTTSDVHSGWWAEAACQSADRELFFPISELAASDRNISEAKAVCGRCRVRAECLAHAMDGGPVLGIWGGTTEKERRLMRSRRRKQASAAL